MDFEKGCKKKNQLSIGVEHEKFIFDNLTNQRANFEAITKVLKMKPKLIITLV